MSRHLDFNIITFSENVRKLNAAYVEARKDASEAQTRIDDAQDVLDDAEEIHATPQETIALREQVSREQADYDRQLDAVEELAENERELRRGTLKQRLILIAGIVLCRLTTEISAPQYIAPFGKAE